MSEVPPVRSPPPLPKVDPVRRDRDPEKRREMPEKKKDDRNKTDPDAPLHIDEYV